MTQKNALRWMFALFLMAAFLFVVTEVSLAIPAFARKYSMSCTTCHAPIPRLKAFGDDFAGNGFAMESQEPPRYTMTTGDDRLELLRSFPLAARFDGFLQYRSDTQKDLDLSAPYNLKLLSGGQLAKNIAYYFYFFLSERGEVAGVEDAYIMFNNLLHRDLDIYIGQFQVSDPLFKRELRLTYEDYMIYKVSSGKSGANLSYDRGIMVTYGMDGGPDIIVEVLNGNGIGEAGDDQTYDTDKFKNFAGRISYDLADHVRIGAFGYYGKEADAGAPAVTNEVRYVGPDLTLGHEKLELNLQYLIRYDDNPEFEVAAPAQDVKTRGGLAEVVYWPAGDDSKWYLVGLYNHIEVDPGGSAESETVYQTLSAHIGRVLKTNLRLVLEGTYDIKHEESRVVAGFVSAF